MNSNDVSRDFNERTKKLAEKCKRENRMIMYHICVRVEDINYMENLLAESFGIGVNGFYREEGSLYDGEAVVSGAWVNEEFYIELMEPVEKQQLGYDTGCSLPIGHLSEVGFLTPDIDSDLTRLEKLGWQVNEHMKSEASQEAKLDRVPPIGFPVELVQINLDAE